MKLKIKKLLIFTIIFSLIVLSSCTKTQIKKIQSHWGVSFSNCQSVYEKNNIGWFGEGENYLILEFKAEPNDLFKQVITDKEEGFIESGTSLEAQEKFEFEFEKITKNMYIENEYLPNLSNIYRWKLLGDYTANHLYMIYFPISLQLYVCEVRF